MLTDVGLLNAKPTPFPMAKALRLMPDMGDPMPNPKEYQRIVRELLSLSLTLLDISFPI